MINLKENLYEKFTLILILLILINYSLFSINSPIIIIKINFIVFLTTLLIFFWKTFFKNVYLNLFFLITILISLGVPTFEWDARSIWLFNGKKIFYDNSIYVLFENYGEFSHNSYPVLTSAFAASLALLAGYWNEVFPKIAFLFIFFPPLILVYSFMKGTTYLIFISIFLFIIGKFLFNGLVDGHIALYFSIATLLMYLIFLSDEYLYKKPIHFILSICFFSTLTLIKNEGLALLLLLFTTIFLIKLIKGELPKDIVKIILLSTSFLPIIAWKLLFQLKGIEHEFINSYNLSNFINRINEIESYIIFFNFILLNEKLIISLVFFLISFWFNKNIELFRFIMILGISYIFILFFVFFSTPYDFYYQLDSTGSRIIKTTSFLFAFFGLYNFRKNFLI